MIMTVLPVVMLASVARFFTNHEGYEILFAGIFGGLGGLFGFIVNYFTKDKSRTVKILALIGIVLTCSFFIYLVVPKEEGMTITVIK